MDKAEVNYSHVTIVQSPDPKERRGGIRYKERRSDNSISVFCQHVPFNQNFNNQEGGKFLHKRTYNVSQENNQPML